MESIIEWWDEVEVEYVQLMHYIVIFNNIDWSIFVSIQIFEMYTPSILVKSICILYSKSSIQFVDAQSAIELSKYRLENGIPLRNTQKDVANLQVFVIIKV